MSWDSNGYIDCRTRLVAALKDWPDLRVVEDTPEIVKIGERHFIQATVTLFRSVDDALPVRAFCFEPFPGKTNFTRDSEQQNSATSALARALGYMGYGIERSIASFDEVRNRQPDEAIVYDSVNVTRPSQTRSEASQMPVVKAKAGSAIDTLNKSGQATEKQVSYIRSLVRKSSVKVDETTIEQLTILEANALIEQLLGGIHK